VLIGIWQHCQKSSTLDGRVQLSLIYGSGTGKTGRDDLSILSNEISQRVYIFVVDFFNASDCEPTKPFTLKK
jgi:hypothetical protein